MGETFKVGIIGGSGFYEMPEMSDATSKTFTTEFGPPSDDLVEGFINGVPCIVLARHGKDHRFNPTEVNYRANIRALHMAGVTNILSATCCGSLKPDYNPGDFLILDSFIDRTTKRIQTFHDQEASKLSPDFGKVCHTPMHPSFCRKTGRVIEMAAKQLGMTNLKPSGTMVTIEGPRFSSRAESLMFRSWGGDVINMTTVPEVVLAKELGMSYASVAMVTDHDCWKDNEETVDAQKVLKVMSENVGNVRRLFIEAIKLAGQQDWSDTIVENRETAKNSVIHR